MVRAVPLALEKAKSDYGYKTFYRILTSPGAAFLRRISVTLSKPITLFSPFLRSQPLKEKNEKLLSLKKKTENAFSVNSYSKKLTKSKIFIAIIF